MKRIPHTIAALFALALSVAPLAAAGVEVPDLETRIRNYGSEVPSAAVPDLPNPAPAPIPEDNAAAEAAPVAPAIVPVPEPELFPETPTPSENKTDGTVSGWASLGAGSPGTLLGDLSVERAGGPLPDFSLRFAYDAADGYGGETAGEGFFDRSISLGFGASSRNEASGAGWQASLGLSERTDGLQGLNAELYGFTARDAVWDASADIPVSLKSGLSASLGISGAVFASFADMPGTAIGGASSVPVTGEPVANSGGYRIEPDLSINLVRGRGKFALEGVYGYETVVNTGEVNTGTVALSAGGTFGGLSLGARSGVALDSASGAAFPFSLSAAWTGDTGILRNLSASGGLDAYRSGVDTLAGADPFVDRTRLSRTAADWFGKASLSLSGPEAFGASTGFEAGAEWRDTAFGFGVLGVLPIDEPASGGSAGLVPVGERERQSLATKVALSATAPGLELKAGWNAEWLDTPAETLRYGPVSAASQRLDAGLTLFDRDARRLWETSAVAAFALNRAVTPSVDLSGTLRPAKAFALTLSFDDIVPLIAGEPRMRDAVYADRSGVLTLSGRIDF